MSKKTNKRRKPNEPMKKPKYTQPFMVDGDEKAQASWYGLPDDDDLNPAMGIEVDSMSLSPKKAREFAKWLLREANYVEKTLKVERFNRKLKAKLDKSAEGQNEGS